MCKMWTNRHTGWAEKEGGGTAGRTRRFWDHDTRFHPVKW